MPWGCVLRVRLTPVTLLTWSRGWHSYTFTEQQECAAAHLAYQYLPHLVRQEGMHPVQIAGLPVADAFLCTVYHRSAPAGTTRTGPPPLQVRAHIGAGSLCLSVLLGRRPCVTRASRYLRHGPFAQPRSHCIATLHAARAVSMGLRATVVNRCIMSIMYL